MAASAGYLATLKAGGTPVSFTAEPTTKSTTTTTANTEYRITDATRRVLDPDSAITVEVDPEGDGSFVTASASSYTVDALDGRIIFASNQGGTAVVRVSATYVPLGAVASARECSMSFACNMLDSTTFASAAAGSGHDAYVGGIQSFTASVDGLTDLLDEVVTGETFADWLMSREPKVVEFTPVPGGRTYRGWVSFEGGDISDTVSDVLSSSLTLHGSLRPLTGRTEVATFTIALP